MTTEITMTQEILNYMTVDNGLFIGLSVLGMLGHAVKKYLYGQLSGSIFDYIWHNNKKRTALAVLTTLGATFGLILGEQLPTQIGAFIMLAFTTGYTADSSVNKDE